MNMQKNEGGCMYRAFSIRGGIVLLAILCMHSSIEVSASDTTSSETVRAKGKKKYVPGPQGLRGESGAAGTPGNHGNHGAPGAAGTSGLQGERGFQGERGLQGERGVDGQRGTDGRDGQDFSFAQVSGQMTITYNAVRQNLAAGTWQLMIITPDGRVFKDTTNGPIDMQNPPTGALNFAVSPLVKGTYAIVIYVKTRTNNFPIDVSHLAGNISLFPPGGKDNARCINPNCFVGGSNANSTYPDDSAQAFYCLFDPS
jgi:hypothetical protein